jgi:DNA-binding GntR family transcriptional regulator
MPARLARPRPRAGRPPAARGAGGRALLPSAAAHRTLEQLAYRDIRRAIAEGRLAPGQRIVASAIAEEAGISRIPVMQALRRLESDGFVRINPHRDVVVRALSPAEFRERFLIMAALEALCVREGAGRLAAAQLARLKALQREMAAARAGGHTARAVAADGEFHRLLWEAGGLPRAAELLQNIWDRGEYYRLIMHARRGGFAAESLAEHAEIIKALEVPDVGRAVRAIEQHRLRAMARLAETT